MTGKLVVIEGADGAGCEEQSKRLFELLKEKGIAAERKRYPDYSGPIGNLIHEFLHGRYEFSPGVLLLLYTADFAKDIQRVRGWLREGRVVVLDRYFTSTLAYQGTQGINLDDIINVGEMLKLPRPDRIIYLKVSPEVSRERKLKEKESLDKNEADSVFISRVLDSYESLARDSVFGNWDVIDANRPVEEVFADIRKALDM